MPYLFSKVANPERAACGRPLFTSIAVSASGAPYREWVGEHYDPELLDVRAINGFLALAAGPPAATCFRAARRPSLATSHH